MEIYKPVFGTWYNKMLPIISSNHFQELGKSLANLRKTEKVYPERQNVFRCFKETNIEKTIVIIWSDEPYASNVSDGLAFSADSPITPYILNKIHLEIENQIYDGLKLNYENDLSYLSLQGVLLYNSNLTVSKFNHDELWKQFNYEFVDLLNSLDWPIYIISMGDLAKQYTQLIKNDYITVQEINHPSESYWEANNCFVECNKFLNKHYGPLIEIIW
jgi:uracil-DNA glycosylase